jgi:hypothetical protein
MWRWSRDELRRTTRGMAEVGGLAGLTPFDSPGLGLAFSVARETDDGGVVGVNAVTGVPEPSLSVARSVCLSLGLRAGARDPRTRR